MPHSNQALSFNTSGASSASVHTYVIQLALLPVGASSSSLFIATVSYAVTCVHFCLKHSGIVHIVKLRLLCVKKCWAVSWERWWSQYNLTVHFTGQLKTSENEARILYTKALFCDLNMYTLKKIGRSAMHSEISEIIPVHFMQHNMTSTPQICFHC